MMASNLTVLMALVCGVLMVGGGVASPVVGHGLRDLVNIDGHETTIAQASAEEIDGTDVALSFLELIMSIVAAFNEPEFDYWGNVKEEVEALVGSYINEHNMNQVEAFQDDLQKLLLRYAEAPESSSNYPDKNQQASALSMAIISNRYLVMSGDLRFSLVLHFEDIASMHIIVLKDAAETYSTPDVASQWWVDLNEELKDYLDYSASVTQELQTWRMDMISCTESIDTCKMVKGTTNAACYDIFTVADGVTGETSECRQVHGASDCTNHCQTYHAHRQREVDQFNGAKVSPVTVAWQHLKETAQQMVDSGPSPYYNPVQHV